MKKSLTKELTSSSIMISLATILSFIKLLDLPYGGSVTLCSMVPILIVAYRFGTYFGLISGFVYSVIQLIFGLKNLSYATSAAAAIAIIFLDYIIAFTVIGLGGVFKKVFKNQTSALSLGMITVCILRYLCHVISGATVWAGLSIPTEEALIYSIGYNATYMLPELLVSVIAVVYLSLAVDFKEEKLERKAINGYNPKGIICEKIGLFIGALTIIIDILIVAGYMQEPDSGAFNIKGVLEANYTLAGVITLIGAVSCFAFCLFGKKLQKTKN